MNAIMERWVQTCRHELPAAPGGCCHTTSRPGRPRITTGGNGAWQACGRRFLLRCGSGNVPGRGVRRRRVAGCWTARASRPPSVVAGTATTVARRCWASSATSWSTHSAWSWRPVSARRMSATAMAPRHCWPGGSGSPRGYSTSGQTRAIAAGLLGLGPGRNPHRADVRGGSPSLGGRAMFRLAGPLPAPLQGLRVPGDQPGERDLPGHDHAPTAPCRKSPALNGTSQTPTSRRGGSPAPTPPAAAAPSRRATPPRRCARPVPGRGRPAAAASRSRGRSGRPPGGRTGTCRASCP